MPKNAALQAKPTNKIMQLKPYNTFGIEASCDFFEPINSLADLYHILANPIYKQKKLPLHILGGGSNVLFTAQHINGCILHNRLRGINLVRQDNDHVWLKVASGEIWHDIVLHSLENNWGGIENLSLIPGTTGAAPIQNIGAYGVELCDVLHSVEVVHLPTQQVISLSNAECQFAYRDSIFKNQAKGQYFIVAITLRLHKKPSLKLQYGDIQRTLEIMQLSGEPTIQHISQAICQIRRSKLPDPAQLGNAGSFFKNPEIALSQLQALKQNYPNIPSYPLPNDRVKIPAAWLIEQCQWRGKRLNDAGVHQNHALVLVNYGNAQGKEIAQLAQQIQSDVQQKFGITINPEVNIWQ